MGWTTYVDAFALQGGLRYYLQRVDDRLAGPHPVVTDRAGRLALHGSEAEAREAALLRDEPLSDHPVEVLDFDEASAWCSHPSAETLDSRLLMRAWHALIHLGVSEEMPVAPNPTDPNFLLGEVADRLHLTEEEAAEFLGRRGWSPSEVEVLAQVIASGIARLALLLAEHETPSGDNSRAV